MVVARQDFVGVPSQVTEYTYGIDAFCVVWVRFHLTGNARI